jgi:precorrin-4/cobalt-precorrin-4 C11-methyltransferase
VDFWQKMTHFPSQHPPLPAAVYIVGAGPGDPELLTVKAQRLLAQADVVVFADSLIPESLVQGMRRDALLVRSADQTLEDLMPFMVEQVRQGRSLVRLHSGDPSLYSAMQEQMQALLEAQIPFEVVPGVSAFQAAAAKLRVELTQPQQVQTIVLTRISGRTQVPAAEELASLAAHQASLCLYLSARHVVAAEAKLLGHYPANTPVAICFRVGWPDEKIRLVALDQMAAITQQENLLRTTLYIVSPALAVPTVPQEIARYGAIAPAPTPAPAHRSRLYSRDHSRLFRPNQADGLQ